MAVFGDASLLAKCGFLLMICGLAIFIGGFASVYWMITQTVIDQKVLNVGLWNMKNCSGSCLESEVYSGYKNDVLNATKYMECVVLQLFVIGTVMYGIYVASSKTRTRCLAFSIIICNGILVLLSFVSMVCWLAQLPSDFYPSYSLGLVLLGTVIALLAGAFMVKEVQSNEFPTVQRITPSPAKDPKEIETPFSPSSSTNLNRNEKRNGRIKYPLSPYTPSTITRFIMDEKSKRYPTYKHQSPPPSYSSSPRRFGTPNAVVRYDYNAR